jgi:hypothetical protein
MNTRFDLRNLAKQCLDCNRFQAGRTYEFARYLNRLWGPGTAELMEKKSRVSKLWDIKELEQLRSAAKLGWLPYLQLYREITSTA